ncbi:MAG TPA: hypothetical protein VKV57_11110 [bacterium]|nr:hypothetical protein [bacterium]
MTEPAPQGSGGDGMRGPAGADRPSTPACPFCDSDRTELLSLFGSTSLTSQYYCRRCRSAFEQVKWGALPHP